MPASNVYTLGAASLNGTTIDQCQSLQLDPGIEEILEGGDGTYLDTYIAVGTQKPILDLETSKIAVALGLTGFEGVKTDSNGFDAYLQKVVSGGARAAGSSHGKLSIAQNNGLILPTTLTLPGSDQRKLGTLGLKAHAFSSDGNAPLVFAVGQAYSITPDTDEGFVAGPASLNGTSLDGVGGVSCDFSISIDDVYVDGEQYPSLIWIVSIKSKWTIDILDLDAFKSSGGLLTPLGAAQAATDSILYGRKVAEGGGRVADVTAEHLKFTFAAGRHKFGTINAPHGSKADAQIVIMPTDNGSDDYVGINVASAIT